MIITVLGWIVRLLIGAMLAQRLPMFLGPEWFPLAVLINAFTLHVFWKMAISGEDSIGPRVLVPYAVLLAVVLVSTGTAAYALPMSGCQQCLADGNSWWWCFAVYGYLCYF